MVIMPIRAARAGGPEALELRRRFARKHRDERRLEFDAECSVTLFGRCVGMGTSEGNARRLRRDSGLSEDGCVLRTRPDGAGGK